MAPQFSRHLRDIPLLNDSRMAELRAGVSVTTGATLTTGWVPRNGFNRVVAAANSTKASSANGFKVEEAWNSNGDDLRTAAQGTLVADVNSFHDVLVTLPFVRVSVTDDGTAGTATVRLEAALRGAE